MQSHNPDEKIIVETIRSELRFETNALTRADISQLSDSELDSVRGFVFPAFCFDNALHSAKALSAKQIVYGASYVCLNGKWEAAEHIWIKFADGRSCDPTYQKQEEDLGVKINTIYFELFSIEVNDYDEVARSLGNNLGSIIGMNFEWFYNAPAYRQFFI